MISEKRIEAALTLLRESDIPMANARALMTGLDDQKKTVLAVEFLKAEGGQGERQEKARASEAYKSHLEKYKAAVYDFEELRNRRQTEILIVETWRSINANQRRGNI